MRQISKTISRYQARSVHYQHTVRTTVWDLKIENSSLCSRDMLVALRILMTYRILSTLPDLVVLEPSELYSMLLIPNYLSEILYRRARCNILEPMEVEK